MTKLEGSPRFHEKRSLLHSIDSSYVAGMLSMACQGMQTSTLRTNFNERNAQLAGWPHHQIRLSLVEVVSVGQQGLKHSNVLIIGQCFAEKNDSSQKRTLSIHSPRRFFPHYGIPQFPEKRRSTGFDRGRPRIYDGVPSQNLASIEVEYFSTFKTKFHRLIRTDCC